MYIPIARCRACGFGPPANPGGIKSAPSNDRLISVLDLGTQPLANDFRKEGEERAGFAPLELMFCPQCSLAQLSVVVKPEILYEKYSYVTSPSVTMREHFASLLRDIATEQSPTSVVEIGSNDGLLLAFLADNGYGNVVGIDPAKNLADKARRSGVVVVNDFFSKESSEAARQAAGEVGLVVARHVFCHIDDWQAFVQSLHVLSSRDTLICIEVPAVMDQIKSCSFDQIYHEHLSYLPIKAMKYLLNQSSFHLHRVIRYPVHGGANLIMIRRNDCATPPHPSVAEKLESEEVTLEHWQEMATEAEFRIVEVRNMVRELRHSGKRVCGYGASAKSTVWINACGLGRKDLEAVYDTTLEKIYCTIPGTDIPVVHEGGFFVDACDYAVVFCWNFISEVLKKQRKWLESGGKFIVPVPKLRVIGIDSIEAEA